MKKVLRIVGVVILVGLLWYLFIKPYDYLVSFEAKTIPGTINQSIKVWSSSLENSEILTQEDLRNLTQSIQFGDSVFLYKWKIKPINDSLSKVKVYITDQDNSLKNKVMILFSDTDFEKRCKESLYDFNDGLNDHLKTIKVTIVEAQDSPGTFCACTSRKTSQRGKAGGMMNDYPLLSSILVNNGVQLNGAPLIEVTKWDKQTDSLQFNFCFPIIRSERLPSHQDVTYKRLFPKRSLKAIYNGNYITSDRAWYALMDYAENNNMEISELPIEIFHDNPNMGGDALKWTAEVYMPLSKENETGF